MVSPDWDSSAKWLCTIPQSCSCTRIECSPWIDQRCLGHRARCFVSIASPQKYLNSYVKTWWCSKSAFSWFLRLYHWFSNAGLMAWVEPPDSNNLEGHWPKSIFEYCLAGLLKYEFSFLFYLPWFHHHLRCQLSRDSNSRLKGLWYLISSLF